MNESQLQVLLDALPDQILRFDRAGRFLSTAGAPSPATPFTEAAVGKTFAQILPPELALLSREAFDKAFSEGGVQPLALANVRPDGPHHFEMRLVATPDLECLA